MSLLLVLLVELQIEIQYSTIANLLLNKQIHKKVW